MLKYKTLKEISPKYGIKKMSDSHAISARHDMPAFKMGIYLL
jgi:hypothetical protein